MRIETAKIQVDSGNVRGAEVSLTISSTSRKYRGLLTVTGNDVTWILKSRREMYRVALHRLIRDLHGDGQVPRTGLEIDHVEVSLENRRRIEVTLTIDGEGTEYDGVLSMDDRNVTWNPNYGGRDRESLEETIDRVERLDEIGRR